MNGNGDDKFPKNDDFLIGSTLSLNNKEIKEDVLTITNDASSEKFQKKEYFNTYLYIYNNEIMIYQNKNDELIWNLLKELETNNLYTIFTIEKISKEYINRYTYKTNKFTSVDKFVTSIKSKMDMIDNYDNKKYIKYFFNIIYPTEHNHENLNNKYKLNLRDKRLMDLEKYSDWSIELKKHYETNNYTKEKIFSCTATREYKLSEIEVVTNKEFIRKKPLNYKKI